MGDTLLYASENEDAQLEAEGGGSRGFYDHGLYPFVFDSLFPVEGSPCGYGFIDLCRNSQTQIDLMRRPFSRTRWSGPCRATSSAPTGP